MKRSTVIITIGALLAACTASLAPAHASALDRHAPPVAVPAAGHVASASHQAARADHGAAPTQEQRITTAILHSKLLGAVAPSDIAVSQIRFAGADHTWAGALATPKNGQTDPAQVLLRKTGNTWTVRDLGTFGVGCGIAPTLVRTQLGLHGPC